MSCLSDVRWRVSSLAALLLCGSVVFLAGQAVSAVEPFTYVYDAPAAASVGLSKQRLSKKDGWTRLKENDTTHCFEGCAVLMNDRIVAVLHRDTPDVDVYSRKDQSVTLCARLRPIGDGGTDLKLTSLAVEENTRGSVSLKVDFRSVDRGVRHVVYEINVGEAFIKATATAGVKKLRVRAPCRFAVMPDFFADDIVVDAATMRVKKAELPSENFLLHMMHGGDAILMTVSESRDNDVAIALSETAPREIVSSDISFGAKPHIWIAILAEEGIWHEQTIRAADADRVIDLDWKMPFAALWRVDWSTEDKLTDSWEMLLQHPQGKYMMQGWFGQNESEGQRFGDEFGPRDWNKPGRKRWNPVLGSFAFPCWIDNDRTGYLQPLAKRRYQGGGNIYPFSGPAVIYPLDRINLAPFSTPLDKLTVVDLVRMTLGVGPCQYILDLEGQKRNSQGVATCHARDVINAIYKEGTQLQNGPVIREHLAAAVAFISNVRERIDQYVEFGRQMSAYLKRQKRLHPQHAEFLDELLLITERLDQFFAENVQRIHTPEYAEQTAQNFRKRLLTYNENDAYEKCGAQMRIFTSIGGAQDGLVASCRMIAKILRQRSGIAMAVNPELKEIATEIRGRTHAVLRNPTAYEAPRH